MAKPDVPSAALFGRRVDYAQAKIRPQLETAYAAAVAATFVRQRERADVRLATLRDKAAVADVAPAKGGTSVRTDVPDAPFVRASDLLGADFDEDLAGSLGPQIRADGHILGAALLGASAWGATNVLGKAVTSVQVDRLGYVARAAAEKLDGVLSGAWRDGLTFDAMAEKIGTAFDGMAGWLADRVGGDEATALVNGTATAAGTWGSILAYRLWVTQGDDLVRPCHEDADGMVVGMDEPFDVCGELLDFPGDPAGSPEASYNCRCYLSIVDENGDVLVDDAGGGEDDLGMPADLSGGVLLDEAPADAAVTASMTFDWDEEAHPRGEDGRFGDGGGDRPSLDDLRAADPGLEQLLSDPDHASGMLGDIRESVWQADEALGVIAAARGYDGTPTIVTEEKAAELVANGWTPVFRGLDGGEGPESHAQADAYKEQFRSGEYYPGLGYYGNGSYFSTDERTASAYAGGRQEAVIAGYLPPDANVVDHDDLVREHREAGDQAVRDFMAATEATQGSEPRYDLRAKNDPDTFNQIVGPYQGPYGAADVGLPQQGALSDPGRYAAAMGYDAIRVDQSVGGNGERYYVVLNRSTMAVQ